VRKAKIVSLAILIAVTVLLILPDIVGEFRWSIIALAVLYGLGFVTLVGYLWLLPAQEKTKSKKKVGDLGEFKTVTSIVCHGCDFSEEREFKAGDYVNKQLGECPRCGQELYVKSIYAIEEKRSRSSRQTHQWSSSRQPPEAGGC